MAPRPLTSGRGGAAPDGDDELRWLCIRARGAELPAVPDDAHPVTDRPMPW